MNRDADQATDLSPLKRALFAIKDLRARLQSIEEARQEPIAIVGMACRFPGAPDLDSYWRLLDGGGDAIREVPPERWDVDAYYDPNPDAPGKSYAREGGFIELIDRFDAEFFGIPPREVVSMDPQQRLLLEVSWEALENAGIPPPRLAGTQTGVFVGIATNEYSQLTIQNDDPSQIDAYVGTGGAACVAAGRIAYLLGLHGPTMALDTACSSSLVAIDLAVQQLRTGRCAVALAGGVNAILSPYSTVYLSKVRALSPTSRCRTFDATADGYVRGEGCGMIVLKRLSDARRDGDTVYGVIRGAASNHDGRSSGLTVPNGQAQQAVVRQALTNAGLAPADVDYIEAHGTGTQLGDPIEVRALGAVLGEGRAHDAPLLLGAVKTNIGHLEAAAGVAGLIKVVLAMRHRRIPASLHFSEPNPHIPWTELPVAVASTSTPWPERSHPPVAGISAFGFSGTNAHVLVEAAPEPVADAPDEQGAGERPCHVLALSAVSPDALRALASRYATRCSAAPVPSAADLAFSANTGRAAFDHRLAVAGESCADFARALQVFAAGGTDANLATGRAGVAQPRIGFLFTGQGSQYAGMGRDLYETEPSFRAAIDHCDDALRDVLDRPLVSVLYGADAGLIDQTAYTQPALFAVEYALAQLWLAWGIEPAFVLGHSVGEYVAACVAGLCTLDDGLRLIAERGRLMQALPTGGRMAAVFASEAAVADVIAPYSARLSIAAVNGPANIVVSGSGDAMDAAVEEFGRRGVRTQPLVVSHAFHSPLMEPMLDAFERAAGAVSWAAPRFRIVSNVTGDVSPAPAMGTGAYWRRHVREAVRFSDSVATLVKQDCTWLIEIGPQPTLLGMAARCVPDGRLRLLPSLRKGTRDWGQMTRTAAELFAHGAAIDWDAFDRNRRRTRVALPTYPFQRERYWIDTTSTRKRPAADRRAPQLHPLLDERLRSPLLHQSVFQTTVSLDGLPFVADHVVLGVPVFPATAYLEMARAAGRHVLGCDRVSVEDFAIEEALNLNAGETHVLQIACAPESGGTSRFEIFSRAGETPTDSWLRHASGLLRAADNAAPAGVDGLTDLRARCTSAVDVADFYGQLRSRGVEYGPAFQGIRQLWRGQDEALAVVEARDAASDEASAYGVHPAFLDSALQVLGATLSTGGDASMGSDLYLPVGVGRVLQHGAPPSRVWSHARLVRTPVERTETLAADLTWYDEDGRLVWEARDVVMKRASGQALRRGAERRVREWLYELDWQTAEVPQRAPEASGAWLVIASPSPLREALLATLAAEGGTCRVVEAAAMAPASGVPGEFGHTPLRGVVYISPGATQSVPQNAASVEQLAASNCADLLTIIQGLAASDLPAPPRVWFVTRGAVPAGAAPWPVDPVQAAGWGLIRVAALEQPQLQASAIDLDPGADSNDVGDLVRELTARADEREVAFRGGARLVPRLVRFGGALTDRRLLVPASGDYRLGTTARGVLENIAFDSVVPAPPQPDEIQIDVRASGLNFRDVLNALGMYPGDPGPMGGECAGRVTAVGEAVRNFRVGDDVIALAGGTLGTTTVTPAKAAVHLPPAFTFEQGASVPATFLTAHYGLHQLAAVKPGDRVLVHAAAGGVGQAAVQIALRAGAEVYGTAGTAEKRAFVKALGARHVFSSRTADFRESLVAMTGGRGVDIVLNSLTGAFIPESLRALAPGGHFLEIGKAEIWTREAVGQVNGRITYTAFDLGEVMLRDIDAIAAMLADVMAGMRDGSLRLLPIRTFDLRDAISAFRYMAQAKHVGKIVVTRRELLAESGFDPEGTYLVTGGTGGLGLEVGRWMASRGARHLVLLSRSGAAGVAAPIIQAMENGGASVRVARGDVSSPGDVRRVLAEIAQTGHPLRGVVHAAGVLDDGLLGDQTPERFARVCAPKVTGSWLLHELTRDQRLDFFALFSSTSAVLGAPGQSGYAAANAFMDALAHARRAAGLPALAVDWGAWSEVGMAARMADRQRSRIADRGMHAIAPAQGLVAFGLALAMETPQLVVLPAEWSRVLQAIPAGAEPPILRALATEIRRQDDRAAARPDDVRSTLATTEPEEWHEVLVGVVRRQVASALGLADAARLDPHSALVSLGLDSLMALELRNALGAALGLTLPPALLFEHPTIDAVATHLEQLLRDGRGSGSGPADATRAPDPTNVDQLSDDQVDALLNTLLTDGADLGGVTRRPS